jgi:hypothetical protein
MSNLIAQTKLLCIMPSGVRLPVTVSVGEPYPGDREWRCPISLEGLGQEHPAMAGADSLQALCLAIRLIRHVLHSLIADGGQVLEPESGRPFPLDAYFSGLESREVGKS